MNNEVKLLREAIITACAAMSLKYAHDGDIIAGATSVFNRHGGAMSFAYQQLRNALAAVNTQEDDRENQVTHLKALTESMEKKIQYLKMIVDHMPLCPDHRDKQRAMDGTLSCPACREEEALKKLKNAQEAIVWVMDNHNIVIPDHLWNAVQTALESAK